MALALREWDRRCAALFASRHPRCGKRQALVRTLRLDQLEGGLALGLTPQGCPEVLRRLDDDDQGALMPGDELMVFFKNK
jgi:hypothetical protein